MKRTPITRTPFKRKPGPGLKRSPMPVRAVDLPDRRNAPPRKPINPVSEQRKRENVERQKVPLLDYCEAKRAGAPGECFGDLHRHEVLSAARGGSRTDPKNIRTVCDGHNTAISQDVATMRWAQDPNNDFLRHGFQKVGGDD